MNMDQAWHGMRSYTHHEEDSLINYRNKREQSGFTLVEVLLVVAILGVLAAMVVPQLLGRQQEAMVKATKTSLHGLEQALKLYAIDHDGNFPTGTSEEVMLLLLAPDVDREGRPRAPYLEQPATDAWEMPFHYEYPSSKAPNTGKPAIWSSGPNRMDEGGGGDDIVNWSR
jgi:general secretion pathway protein G